MSGRKTSKIKLKINSNSNSNGRFDGPKEGRGVATSGPVHPYRMTIRDIEAEAIARLARKGHDWSGTLRGRRERNPPAGVTRDANANVNAKRRAP